MSAINECNSIVARAAHHRDQRDAHKESLGGLADMLIAETEAYLCGSASEREMVLLDDVIFEGADYDAALEKMIEIRLDKSRGPA